MDTSAEFMCSRCSKSFTAKRNLTRHMKIHEGVKLGCTQCSFSTLRNDKLKAHVLAKHSTSVKRKTSPTSTATISKKSGRLQWTLNMFASQHLYPTTTTDLVIALSEVRSPLMALLLEVLLEGGVKWYIVQQITFTKINAKAEEISTRSFFRSPVATDFTEDFLEQNIDEAFEEVKKSFEDFLCNGSGWTLEKVGCLEVKIVKYRPLAANN